MSEPTDEALMVRAREGEIGAFAELAARNWIRNAVDRRARRPPVVSLHDQLGPTAREALRALTTPEDVPERELLRGYERFRIRRAIADLPEAQRLVFVLSHFEDLPYAEVGRLLDIPVGTVKSRMHHACRKLREALAEEE